MNATKLTILLSCILSAMTCSATKYQIKVLNTPTIIIDNRTAKVGDWFDDSSVISWTKENQAMRVLSDENRVYTLSAKLYKEAKAKKFSDFIAYTKPLAVRGASDDSLIAQLQERFDQDFIMLDEIVIDLSDLCLNVADRFIVKANENNLQHTFSKIYNVLDGHLCIFRKDLIEQDTNDSVITLNVTYLPAEGDPLVVSDYFEIEVLSIL